ncbi:protein kinase domain-containing protein [Actinomadura darangshiensis]|uniref:protein kinase domain-containing protein n=1 Tax=Actinomadura darangshiensis TaxID=705336 RepID=UPI0014094170|nr:protein kinase [Actinomadura darangshiensis]
MRLTERYRLVERLDDGGTMEVWRAWDELLGRPVAVKLLAPAHAGLHRAFQEGVNRAAGLSHAVLETVYDSDQTRDASGRLVSFVVTEFVAGETLAGRLRRGPLTASEAAGVCGQVADALGAAHTGGVTHGDLRPGKVMLIADEVRVTDTGIGGIVRSARTNASRTADLAVTTGAAEAKAADVHALGTILAACLAPGTSEALSALAARCMGSDTPSAAEVAGLLARDDTPPNAVFVAAASADPPGGHRTRTLRPPAPPRRRGARLAALALVVAIPVTAAAAILASAPRTPAGAPPPAADAVPTQRTAPPRTPPAQAGTDTPGPGVTGTAVTEAIGRLRPIVSRGYASGEIRSDVAIDLNNVITNLENDLTADRGVDVGDRIALLHDKIDTRRQERGLSPDLAAELDRVLATVQA